MAVLAIIIRGIGYYDILVKKRTTLLVMSSSKRDFRTISTTIESIQPGYLMTMPDAIAVRHLLVRCVHENMGRSML